MKHHATVEEVRPIVEACITRLMEHCEAVQIAVSFPSAEEARGTDYLDLGAGNYFARVGQLQNWLDTQRHADQANAVAVAMGDDDGDTYTV